MKPIIAGMNQLPPPAFAWAGSPSAAVCRGAGVQFSTPNSASHSARFANFGAVSTWAVSARL